VNKNPTDATVCGYLFTAKLLYMFRVSQRPSSGVLKTVPVASGTGHTICTATPLQRGLIGTASRSDHDQTRSWYSFLLEAESTSRPQCGRQDCVNEKFQLYHRESSLPACSAVPQPTAPPRAPRRSSWRWQILDRY